MRLGGEGTCELVRLRVGAFKSPPPRLAAPCGAFGALCGILTLLVIIECDRSNVCAEFRNGGGLL